MLKKTFNSNYIPPVIHACTNYNNSIIHFWHYIFHYITHGVWSHERSKEDQIGLKVARNTLFTSSIHVINMFDLAVHGN